MTTLQQAAQQALKALEATDQWDQSRNFLIPYRVRDPIHASITALHQALAADTKPCACCGDGKASISVTRVCDTCGSEYAGQAEMGMAKRIESEPVAQPFNTWSSNEGDSWYDDPADAQIIEDVFGGDMPVIGDEYEVLAGWRCVTARYCIAFVSDDGDCEVDCISHPCQQPAQQPQVPLVDRVIKAPADYCNAGEIDGADDLLASVSFASDSAQQPLTDEQIDAMWQQSCREHFSGLQREIHLARAIEHAHGIK